MEMTNFQPALRDMAIFRRSPCQKVVKLHLYPCIILANNDDVTVMLSLIVLS